MLYYIMLIQNIKTGTQANYISDIPGDAPKGWKCICYNGYVMKKDEVL